MRLIGWHCKAQLAIADSREFDILSRISRGAT